MRSSGDQADKEGAKTTRRTKRVVFRVLKPTSQIEALLLGHPNYHSQLEQRRILEYEVKWRSRDGVVTLNCQCTDGGDI